MESYDVAGYHVRGMIQGLISLGLDANDLLKEVQIEPYALQNPEARFAETQVFTLWSTAELRYGMPSFGLALATHIPFGALELVDYLVATCSTAGAGFECLDYHARLCASGFYFRIEAGAIGPDERGKFVYLEHRHGVQFLPRSVVEYLCSLMITRFRSVCGPDFRPVVRLRQTPTGSESAYREAFGRTPELGDRDVIFVPDAQWQLDNARRDPTLSALLRAHARDVVERLPGDDFEARVRAALVESLHLGHASIQHVGARLGLVPRTLQRRLEEGNTTFHALVESVRSDFAVRYLSTTQLSITEISRLLAYTGPSAFGRAFRRWTGSTPAEFRESHMSSEVRA